MIKREEERKKEREEKEINNAASHDERTFKDTNKDHLLRGFLAKIFSRVQLFVTLRKRRLKNKIR